jgi:hypothetical protein
MATETVPQLERARYTRSTTLDETEALQLEEVKMEERWDTATALREAWTVFFPIWKKQREERAA